ncbi:hypothetical protein H9P43_009479 [Blastocladiella emersonii ATCC 22665]|nr:hypothetical protein H9P43_009479 [Blastocladiella emersonii ATCC 22665]
MEFALAGFAISVGLKDIGSLLSKLKDLVEAINTAREFLELSRVPLRRCTHLYDALNSAPLDADGEPPAALAKPTMLLRDTLAKIQHRDTLVEAGNTLTQLAGDLQLAVQLSFSPLEMTAEIKLATEAANASLLGSMEELLAMHHSELYRDLALNNKDVPEALAALQSRLNASEVQNDKMMHMMQQMFKNLHGTIVRHSTIHIERTDSEKALDRLAVTSFDFTESDIVLGRGGFGEVVSATWIKSKTEVAIKRLLPLEGRLQADRPVMDMVAKEALIWSNLHHPHILPLLGVSLTCNTPFLVMPLMEGGDLSKYAAGRPREHLRLLHETAQGMAYLHGERILHGDLKANNVLVDGYGRAQVCDFGQSRALSQASRASTFKSGSVGNVRWMAPERYKRGAKYDLHPDLFAFAMLAYEVVAGNIPFHDEHDVEVVKDWIKEGERPDPPTDAASYSPELWALVVKCWAHDWTTRPTFAAVVTELSVLRPPTASASDLPTVTVVNQLTALKLSPASLSPSSSVELPVAASADGFEGLVVPTELDGDRFIWEQRHKLASGARSSLNVTELAVGPYGLDVIERVRDFPQQRMTELILDGCALGPNDARTLATSFPRTLRVLNLNNNPLGDRGVKAIAYTLPEGLAELYLFNTQITDIGVYEIVAMLPRTMTALSLACNQISDNGAIAIAARMPSMLDELYLGGNQFTDEGAIVLAPSLPRNLARLSLEVNRIGYAGAVAIAARMPPSLRELSLYTNQITSAGAEALAFQFPPTLRKLNLSNNPLGDAGAVAIAARMPRMLCELYLGGTGITDRGAGYLGTALPPTLMNLGLENNQIGDSGAGAIAGNFPMALRMLFLSDNQIGDAGAEEIARYLPQSLASLYLHGNKVGFTGRRALKTVRHYDLLTLFEM